MTGRMWSPSDAIYTCPVITQTSDGSTRHSYIEYYHLTFVTKKFVTCSLFEMR